MKDTKKIHFINSNSQMYQSVVYNLPFEDFHVCVFHTFGENHLLQAWCFHIIHGILKSQIMTFQFIM